MVNELRISARDLPFVKLVSINRLCSSILNGYNLVKIPELYVLVLVIS